MSALSVSVPVTHLTQFMDQIPGQFSEFSTMSDRRQVKTKLDQSLYKCIVENM